ncbi:hypothetical protein BG011_001726 [Mortierella polycephala]|uniref:Uncharacterized protein n=1 Tax=Mortierella polycephala TaxID=41804 RepID=A0A9P6Q885_9FUNG|nr:hypothetical protein BG011_001726 [Mortierella polycephala]
MRPATVSTSSELGGHKDVIRIAYIPSMISESSLITTPGPSAQINGAPQPRFLPLRNEDRSKHDSVASNMSGIVDEAVVMAVPSKATPQVMRLNTIKATKSDLIQRSNTLHSSNSIQRSRSQRRIADANNSSNSGSSRMNPSPLSGAQSDTESEQGSDHDDASRARAVQTRRPSAASTAESDAANPFLSQAELTAEETSPSNARQHHRNSTANASTRSSNPFLSISESTAVASNTNTMYSTSTSSPSTPTSESATVFASIPITLADHHYDPNDPTAGLPEPNLRPWTSSGSVALRDSTFSTLSDARSSTRGDGEEIMIFWDGHRDSKASNL